METEGTPLELYYGNLRLGMITGPYEDHGTWFGDFEGDVDRLLEPTADEIRSYIAFSTEWQRRLDDGEDPDDGPWRTTFAGIITSDQWGIDTAGGRSPIEAPMFGAAGEVSWRYPDE